MTELLGDVNRYIRELAAKLDPHNDSLWQFVCECGAPNCAERVSLSLAGYDALESADDVVTAPGHDATRSTELS